MQDPVRLDYQRRMNNFWEFVALWDLPLTSHRDFDNGACEWADFQFQDVEPCHVGEMCKAALGERTAIHHPSRALQMPRFRRVLRSWKKDSPKRSRLPMPVEFMFLMSLRLLLHQASMGLHHTTLFTSYLRPSVLFAVSCGELVAPVKDVGNEPRVLVQAPFEKERSTKVGYYDDTFVLSSKVVPEIGELLGLQAHRRLAEARRVNPQIAAEDVLLRDFKASEVLAAWRQAVAAEGLQESMESPHQARHEGASHDLLMGFRDEAGVRDRGHWASLSSARIYWKPARVQKLVSGLMRGQLEQAQAVAASYAVWCRSGTFPRAVGRRAVAPPVDW